MSDRERWIVYPLLLLAVGLALQPKLVPVDVQLNEVKCDKLMCNELIAKQTIAVIDPKGSPQAELKSTNSGGQIEIVRYSRSARSPKRDVDIRMYASDGADNFIPLGIARLRSADPKPEGQQEADGNPSVAGPSSAGPLENK